MSDCLETYWQFRLEACKKALERNHFRVWIAGDTAQARTITIESILPGLDFRTVSWGDSMTLHAVGILEDLKANPDCRIIHTFDPSRCREELIERRRQALLADLFFTGTSAVTEAGQLVNLDMVGNRVAAITFGPKHVVLYVGRNKLAGSLQDAMNRIKTFCAPVNAIRHPDLNPPCRKTGRCTDCSSPDRICNSWTITEKSYPRGRIHIVLINADLGL
jgi:hypothetical protein